MKCGVRQEIKSKINYTTASTQKMLKKIHLFFRTPNFHSLTVVSARPTSVHLPMRHMCLQEVQVIYIHVLQVFKYVKKNESII